MRNQKEKNTCSICLEPGDGFHFGAQACKACAAFFRRSVALKKTYQCRGDGYCDITITDWISWCFEDFVNLELLQKNILFRHFYTPFYMMEGAFLSHIHNRSDAVVLPSGDYIDMNRLETFYKNLEDAQPLSKEQIDDIFKPSYDMHRKCLILPMMSEKLDLFEFFALTTLLLWDTGLENLTDQTIEIGKKNKDQVMKELAFYMKTVKSIEEPAVRVGSIVNLLPAAHKSTRRIQDDLEMTQVFKIYTPSQEFYNMVNGNF
ncbi:hypothetical protein CAEBREN_19210 [Caenorhabditis brenneri]|uniref:Nuclear receptor domain-containing protein n=1 Tax=Caenorhabditis brenneri TaxID=135651 RepID=G0MN94_CAEBE|nr:hypothetical protein CAEBREN_19210 [Caenorhabditis brenneri]